MLLIQPIKKCTYIICTYNTHNIIIIACLVDIILKYTFSVSNKKLLNINYKIT